MTHIILIRPEIPPNTGNIARLCAATGSLLHIVGPIGFRLDDATLRRAGLDYWPLLQLRLYENITAFLATFPDNLPIWCVETGSSPAYHTIAYPSECAFAFGSETCGLSPQTISQLGGRQCHIPILEPRVRSLNLSNCVAIVLYEHLRQHSLTTSPAVAYSATTV